MSDGDWIITIIIGLPIIGVILMFVCAYFSTRRQSQKELLDQVQCCWCKDIFLRKDMYYIEKGRSSYRWYNYYCESCYLKKDKSNLDSTTDNISSVNDNQKLSVVKYSNLDEECPKCSSKLRIVHLKNNNFIGCKNYPNCRYTRETDKQY